MKICRLLCLCLALLLFGASIALAAESKLAFDLVPDPRPSATDIEDPEWRGFVGRGFLSYLRGALDGNALSMAELAIFTRYYGDISEKKYPIFPAAMHHQAYWHKWITRFTSEAWAFLQQGHIQKVDTSQSAGEYYYEDAADAGNAEAMFLSSKIIAADSERRKKWYFQSVEQGNQNALSDLAWAYLGENVSLGRTRVAKDIAKSWEYRKKAASVGHCLSLAYLGQRYVQGDGGFPVDETTAYIYYSIAVHFMKSADEITSVNHYGTGLNKLPERLSPEQLALAKKTAAAWIATYEASYAKALEEARKRRTVVLEELRQELAPVVRWFEERDAAARQAREAIEAERDAKNSRQRLAGVAGLVLFVGLLLYFAIRKKKLPGQMREK
jgi:hypothetical protein